MNNQLFRHVERPGWRLSWTWGGKEVIWGMWGAEATQQGDCSRLVVQSPLPHSCEKRPVIIDLFPSATYNLRVSNCCKAGVLSSTTQDPAMSGAAFQLSVGAVSSDSSSSPSSSFSGNKAMPTDFSLGLPGYSCGDPIRVPPSKFDADRGRRWTQALGMYF